MSSPTLAPSPGGGKGLPEASGGAGAQAGGTLPDTQGRELHPHIQCHNITGFRQEKEKEKKMEKEKENKKGRRR